MSKKQYIDEGTVIIITGASSGIGKELAIQLAKFKTNLVLIARRRKLLYKLKAKLERIGAKVLVINGDIRTYETQKSIIEKTLTTFGKIDILVNNAGIGKVNYFAEQPEEEIDQLITTNLSSVIKLTRLVVPIMKANKQGHIINISSALAYIPNSAFAVYCATKAAIKTFSDSIRGEVKRFDINVSTVYPGPYKTEFNKVAGIKGASLPGYDVRKLVEEIIKLMCSKKRNLISPKIYVPLISLLRILPPIRKMLANFISREALKGKFSDKMSTKLIEKKDEIEGKNKIKSIVLSH